MTGPQPIASSKVRRPLLRALARERLDDALVRVWDAGVGLVVAPAGSGKTTLLSQFAAASGVPVAWYAAEPADGSTDGVLAHLQRAFATALGLPDGPEWQTIEDCAAALDAWPGVRALLIVDDLHELAGTAAERDLEWLVEHLPSALAVLAASRRPPRFNLSRLRVSGRLLEIDADDLRFRSWEVERLFRDFYGEPLPPEDLASLARRTEGWAAGLQLFHLATQGKPAGERRRLLASLGTRSRLVRDYLARNVLGELAEGLREFLLGTCVLGRLSGPLCDELLGRTDSGALLEELERRQIFTYALDDGGSFRYHEVLRGHLETLLLEQMGVPAARERYRVAGALLEGSGALREALQAYCRAEDWEAAARLLGGRGEQVIGDTGAWLATLPSALADHDPWLLLALARHHVSAGRLDAAVASYRAAEEAFGAMTARDTCMRERLAVTAWLQATPPPQSGWSGQLRMALRRSPLGVRDALAGSASPADRLVLGLACLAAGRVSDALVALREVAELDELPSWVLAAAQVGAALAANLVEVDGPPGEIERAGLEAERLGVPMLARAARAALVFSGRAGVTSEASEVATAAERVGDAWGAALAGMLAGLGGLRRGEPVGELLQHAGDAFEQLGAPVLAVWCAAAGALAAVADNTVVAGDVELVLRRAGTLGVPAAQALALTALGRLRRRGDHHAEALAIARDCGLDLDGLAPGSTLPEVTLPDEPVGRPDVQPDAHVVLRCFDRFRLTLDGVDIDCTAIKPRARAALHLLALRAGAPVHRDLLVDALWPEVDARSGTRNLQVAISAVRQLLEPGVARGAACLLVREGDTYLLAVPEAGDVDLWTFDHALARARSARGRGDRAAEAADLEEVLACYAGELLAEEGAAEWVVKPRERYRLDAADAAVALAELRLRAGDTGAAAAVCERGLRIDRYNDPLWRLLATAYEVAGNAAAAARARAGYDEVLVELGLDAD